MIVIDLGCASYDPPERSIERLLRRYRPELFFGFDPLLPDSAAFDPKAVPANCVMQLEAIAAWTYDGEIEFARIEGERAWDSTIVRDKNSRNEWEQGEIVTVPCFDFAYWFRKRIVPINIPTVVKMDVEGAEFELIQELVDAKMDRHITALLVEWHDHKMPSGYGEWRKRLERSLACGYERWE